MKVSRPIPWTANQQALLKELEQLLDTGAIPCSQTGMLRRIRFEDLMAYKQQQAELRWQEIAQRTPMSQDFKTDA